MISIGKGGGAAVISIGQAVDRVVARLSPEHSIELKLRARRYRIGGTSEVPRIERWRGRAGVWCPVAPLSDEGVEVLQALAKMQWRSRAANAN